MEPGYMITVSQPTDWRDLQSKVAQILHQCGFTVALEKAISTARGPVEIDVYAEESINGRRYIVLAECKHWKARVPKQVIHAFRTLVADSGANLGYIISSSGFQSGALTAAELTNVRLLTWNAFQLEFEETWLKQYLVPFVTERFDALLTYLEPATPRGYADLSAKDKDRYKKLHKNHAEFGALMMQFTTWAHIFKFLQIPAPPIRNHLRALGISARIPSSILDAPSYQEFLKAALAYGDLVLAEFAEIFGVHEA